MANDVLSARRLPSSSQSADIAKRMRVIVSERTEWFGATVRKMSSSMIDVSPPAFSIGKFRRCGCCLVECGKRFDHKFSS